MKAAHQYAFMALGTLLIFIQDVARGTYVFLMFPIIIPVFFLCVFGMVVLWNEPESIECAELRRDE